MLIEIVGIRYSVTLDVTMRLTSVVNQMISSVPNESKEVIYWALYDLKASRVASINVIWNQGTSRLDRFEDWVTSSLDGECSSELRSDYVKTEFGVEGTTMESITIISI